VLPAQLIIEATLRGYAASVERLRTTR